MDCRPWSCAYEVGKFAEVKRVLRGWTVWVVGRSSPTKEDSLSRWTLWCMSDKERRCDALALLSLEWARRNEASFLKLSVFLGVGRVLLGGVLCKSYRLSLGRGMSDMSKLLGLPFLPRPASMDMETSGEGEGDFSVKSGKLSRTKDESMSIAGCGGL